MHQIPARHVFRNRTWIPVSGKEPQHLDTSMSPPLFVVSNHHDPDAGVPPMLNGDEPHVYHSYFENSDGEQAVFVYDRETQQAVLWCGAAGWQPYPVREGRVDKLLRSGEEQLWLHACWQAVTRRQTR
jgi:hypothetical protein